MANSTARGHGKIANWGSVAVARIFDDTGFSSTPEDNCGAGLLTGRKFSPTRVRREIQRWVMPVAVYSPTGLRFTSRWQLQRRRRNESSSEYSTLQGSHCVSTFTTSSLADAAAAERLHEMDHSRAGHDHEDRGEDKQHERDQELDRCLLCAFLGALPSFRA